MPKAHEVATELRKLADALDAIPEMDIPKPLTYFPIDCLLSEPAQKSQFLGIAQAFPRPFEKKYMRDELELRHETEAFQVWTRIRRSSVCRIVKPAQEAVYECEPILSEEEEAALGAEGRTC